MPVTTVPPPRSPASTRGDRTADPGGTEGSPEVGAAGAGTPLDALERRPVRRDEVLSGIDARLTRLRRGAAARDGAALSSAARLRTPSNWRGTDLDLRRDTEHSGVRESAAIAAAIAIERARATLDLDASDSDGERAALDAELVADASGVKGGAKVSGGARVDTSVGDVALDGSGDVTVDASGNVRGGARGSASYDSGAGTKLKLDVDGSADASGLKGGARVSGSTRVETGVGDVALDGSGDVSVDASGTVRGGARGSASYDSGDGTKLKLDVDGSADANGFKGGARASGSTRVETGVGDVALDGSGDVSVDASGNVRGGARGSASYDSGDGTKLKLDVDGSADASGLKGGARVSGGTRVETGIGDVALDGSGDVSVDASGTVRGSARGSASYDSGAGTKLKLDVDGSADASGLKGGARLSGGTRVETGIGDVALDGSGDVTVDASGNIRGSARGSATFDSGDGTKLKLEANGSADASGLKGAATLSASSSVTLGDVAVTGVGDVSVDSAGAVTSNARVSATTTVAGARVEGSGGVKLGTGGVSGDVTTRANLGQGKGATSVDGTLKVDSGGVRADANVRWERQVGSGSAGVQATTERVGASGTLKIDGTSAQLDGSVGIERNALDATGRVRGELGDLGGRIAFGKGKREAGGDATTMVTLGSFQGRALVRGRIGRATEAKDLGAVAGVIGQRKVQLERSTVVEGGGGFGVLLAGAVAGAGADGRRTTRASWTMARPDAEAQAILADPSQHEIPSLARPAAIAIGDVVTVSTEGELSLYVEAGLLGATVAGRASVAGELVISAERKSEHVVRVTVAPTSVKRASIDGKAVILTATLSAADLRGLSHTFDLDLSTRAGREAYAAALCGRLPGPDEIPSSAVALVDELNATLPEGVRAVALADERARSWAVSGSLAYLLVGMTLEYDETRAESRIAESGKVTVRRGSSQGTTRRTMLSGTAQARVSAEVITEEDAGGSRVRGVSLVARFVDDAMRPRELERIVSELRTATGKRLPSFAGVSGEKREIELEVLIDAEALGDLIPDEARVEVACAGAALGADAAAPLLCALRETLDVGRRADAIVDFVQAHGLRGVGAIARAWPGLPLSLRGRTDAYARVLADAHALLDTVFREPSSPEAWLFFERATLVAPLLMRLNEAIDALEVDPFFDDVDGKLMEELCDLTAELADLVDLRHLSTSEVGELFEGLHTAGLLHPAHAYGLVLAELQARGRSPRP